MSNSSTKIIDKTVFNLPLGELIRQQVESTVNDILETERSAFLGYEKHSSDGYNTGNSRNGYYYREYNSTYGPLKIKVPRDRNGEFKQHTIPAGKSHSDDLETTVIQLYKRGVTTRQIADLIEQMYGAHYSPQTVSNITACLQEQVEAFHSRPVSSRYAVLYLDATYLNLRRNSVAKEAVHVILGITPDGRKEVLDYAVYPTEASANYEEMLQSLMKRGLQQVLFVVTDGLDGMKEMLQKYFPSILYQKCYVHLSRNISMMVRPAKRKEVLDDFKKVYRAADAVTSQENLNAFLNRWGKEYPKLIKKFEDRSSLFSFYEMPPEIRSSLYSSNLIENNNKGLKHRAKLKEQFPNEASLERFLCTYYCDYNRQHGEKAHYGFAQAEAQLLRMFNELAD